MLVKIAVLIVIQLASAHGGSIKKRSLPPGLPQPPNDLEAVAKRALCPEGGGDKDAGCPYWKTLGFCNPGKGYLDFMEETCQVTCGFCEARPTPPPRAALARVNEYECLRAHNTKRAIHGARPLTWDRSLVRDAEKWALELANNDEFKHSPWSGQGENLYYVSRVSSTPITCEDAVEAWYDEVKDYPFNHPPRTVFDVKGKQIGHFTQLVWKNTEEVGVAISVIKRGLWYSTYVVARYTPPGNYNGKFAQMVGNIRSGRSSVSAY
ncbi:ectin-like [Actinia tenebrosa]|uniref:Ectin-like n=1 Tax=Actinia tenebrosa TaxID=6105 RepID=A0A6P8HSU5_ACTTE|nr:ectin-like [Actinia tenebrosa]XP_031559464.1 ectin-like [Actinia tenebrosa]